MFKRSKDQHSGLTPDFSVIPYVTSAPYRYLEPTSPLEEGPCQPYEELEAQLPSALLEELFGVTLLIVRLKDLPANIQSALTIQRQGKVAPLHTHTKYKYCE